ncbi:MAG: hypothetical protein M1832_005229 [Thelocarpon impressellum]|nr:MAG: hypothetical protein M1832_005229 [Thelocarpon impressellum]
MARPLLLTFCALIASASAVSDFPDSTETSTSYRPIPTPPESVTVGANVLPNVRDPDAVDAQTVCPGYAAYNVLTTARGLTASLTLAGTACNVYGTDISELNLTVEYQADDRLHVEIVPYSVDASNASHYILPDTLVTKPRADGEATANSSELEFSWSNTPSFSFTVKRRANGDVLFSTEGKKLVFENQFIEFATALPPDYNLYGLGEVIHGLRLGNNLTRTIYAADYGDPIDRNIYGSHPFYLDTRYYRLDADSGKESPLGEPVDLAAAGGATQYTSRSHGVYLRNAHGQEVLLREPGLTWRTIGGSVDLYFYAGPTQPEVTRSYVKSAAGLPAMQQYFTLGFHQCRWGYTNWTQLEEVVDGCNRSGIPLETVWADIDYMNQRRNFEHDQNTYSYEEGERFLGELHAAGRHFVPIIDSAIYIPNPNNASDVYPTFDRGNDSRAFLKNPDGSLYAGLVWPGIAAFPDWLAEKAGSWWSGEMASYHAKVAYDGAWIDMSEAASFCIGSCGSGNISQNPVHAPFMLNGEDPSTAVVDYPEGDSRAPPERPVPEGPTGEVVRGKIVEGVRDVNYPPYTLDNINGELGGHAVSPNATHADGTLEYDVHNLFGHQILNATYRAMLDIFPGKRPFVIGRSTFVGSGAWAGHWGGDNHSQWRYMFFSIPQALAFSLFGIPMFGTDACGFNGNTNEELCGRWMQMSAFFPFFRNHNTLAAAPQEPYVWPSVAEATRTAMAVRFALLPYIYTLLHRAHSEGSTVMRALAWEFPDDPSLAAADRQFLLGRDILVTPVMTPGATTVDAVFPGMALGGRWYDWYTHAPVNESLAGQNTSIPAPLGHIPVHVRGGAVLATQGMAPTTREARRTPWSVLAALGGNGLASGNLYLDDGESLAPTEVLDVEFLATSRALRASAKTRTYTDANPLTNVTVLGLGLDAADVQVVSFNGVGLPEGWSYNASAGGGMLSVTGLEAYGGPGKGGSASGGAFANATSDSRNETQADGKGAWSQDWVLEWS